VKSVSPLLIARRTVVCIALGATLPASTAVAQPASSATRAPGAFDFSISNIMRGPELYGRAPQRVQWTPDGRWIYFAWNPPGTDWREPLRPHRVRATAGAQPERVTDLHMDSIGPVIADGSFTRDRRMKATAYEGDLYVVDMAKSTARRLTETVAPETSPSFSADGQRVFFVRDNNVFSIELDGGLVRQLTDVRPGPAPKQDSIAK
jgi:dipeptidyl aminopeptidase/acylaminoacyl peptidase